VFSCQVKMAPNRASSLAATSGQSAVVACTWTGSALHAEWTGRANSTSASNANNAARKNIRA
jgi:hypothetical protein